jgi:hypothetical protein
MTLSGTLLETLWPYLVVVAVAFLPSEIWRLAGVVLGRDLDQNAEILVFVRGVATALLAGMVAKILFQPSGALQGVPLAIRLAALAVGLAGYYACRRSLIAAILCGEGALVALAWRIG